MEGPVIFVAAPHSNQFVDPLLIMQTCRRPIKFLMAATSLKKGIPGFFGRLLQCIPVERTLDLAVEGPGVIVAFEADGNVLVGKNTKFTEITLKSDNSLTIIISVGTNTNTLPISKIIDDEHISLLYPPENNVQKTLKCSSLSYQLAPKIDQTKVYSAVFDVLDGGEALGIFPEGGSHDQAEMLPLKAGVALMALGAQARNPSLKLCIIPVGLTFFNPDKFRSRAIIEYGDPIHISPALLSLWKGEEGEGNRRKACSQLLDQLFYSLSTVTINVPDWETLQVVQVVRRLYQPSTNPLSSFQLLELTRRLIKGYLAFQKHPKIQSLLASTLEYNQMLSIFRLHDHQVKGFDFSRGRAAFILAVNCLILMGYVIVVAPGTILNLPATIIIHVISQGKAKESTAKSTVKIRGRDVLASWKVIMGIIVIPFLYSVYSLLITCVLVKCGWIDGGSLFRLFIIFILNSALILPIISYSTVKVMEQGVSCWYSIRPLWLSLLSPKRGERLRSMRLALKREIIQLVGELGPQLWGGVDEFERSRIVPRRRPSLCGDIGDGDSSLNVDYKDTRSPIDKRISSVDDGHHQRYYTLDDTLDTVMSGFEYMRSSVFGNDGNADNGSSFALDWSHVDPFDIDDIFFTSPSTPPTDNKKNK